LVASEAADGDDGVDCFGADAEFEFEFCLCASSTRFVVMAASS
jgi:hypothetical protein